MFWKKRHFTWWNWHNYLTTQALECRERLHQGLWKAVRGKCSFPCSQLKPANSGLLISRVWRLHDQLAIHDTTENTTSNIWVLECPKLFWRYSWTTTGWNINCDGWKRSFLSATQRDGLWGVRTLSSLTFICMYTTGRHTHTLPRWQAKDGLCVCVCATLGLSFLSDISRTQEIPQMGNMPQRGPFKAETWFEEKETDRKCVWLCVLQRVEGNDAPTVGEFRGENTVNRFYGLK